MTPGRQPLLGGAERQLDGDGQQCDEDRTTDKLAVVVGLEAVDDEAAEAAAADECRDRRGGDDLHRGGAHSSGDEGKRERHLDPAQ